VKDARSAVHGIVALIVVSIGAVPVHGQQADTGPAAPASAEPEQEVIISGYRRSLEEATFAKRDAVTFSDSVFAEDIGKFPDLNIAESLNRIPGVQLTRDVNGEGVNVSIRGLGTNFTHVTVNGAQIQVASTGRLDSPNQNRELDLELFPTELFTRLDVYKTPTADLLEGGAAGTVNMRAARPFDNPSAGAHFNYSLQEGFAQVGRNFSPRGSLLGSWTNDTFGVLAGVAAVGQKSTTTGYETIGWTNPTVTYGMCGTPPPPGQNLGSAAATCNTTGGNGWTFPGIPANSATNPTTGIGSVPAGVGNGLTQNTPINGAFLLANNPGLTLNQIGNALLPRLGRHAYISGVRNRVAEIFAVEFRPSDELHAYVDTMYAKATRNFTRLDMDLVGRSGAIIPLNEKVDANDVVTSATLANAQYFLEDRPYKEYVTFLNINPGLHWQPLAWIGVDYQMNLSRSTFLDSSPSVDVVTPLGQGITVNYSNPGMPFPNTTNTNVNLNDPNAGWIWNGGRVNLQDEHRDTLNRGAHLDVQIGKEPYSAKLGAAFDDNSRVIRALDNSPAWQVAVCAGNGTYVPAPAPQPTCDGRAGSLLPQSALASYIHPGPGGFVQVDTNKVFADTNYYTYEANAPIGQGAATGASSGGVQEKTWGGYLELNADQDVFGHMLRANAGVRYIKTIQTIIGPYIYSGIVQQGPWQSLVTDYDKVLPSGNLAFNVRDDVVLRFAASKTLTRPDPSQMLPATTFTDPSGQTAMTGNPNLAAYTSKNLDLGGEWYTGAEGYIGVDLFQKKVTGFTVVGITTVPFNSLGIPLDTLTATQQAGVNSRGGPDGATVQLQQQKNAAGVLTIRGIEANWVQPLGRLWDPLDGFGYTVNYTHLATTSDAPGVTAQVLGISPRLWNTTLYYDKHGLSVRLSYVWQARQITGALNQNGIPLAQLFGDPYHQLDMSASYEFSSLPTSPQIVLNAINITDSKQRATFQFENATFNYYNPGYQILLGIRGKW
jgi:TonB-dependent receptor